MMWRIHTKSMVLGGVLGAGLCLLIGAAKNELLGPVGRFQVDCTQNGAYVVDTITGQVWNNSEREFRPSKIRSEPAQQTPPAAKGLPGATQGVESPKPPTVRTPDGFIGKWLLSHPTEGQLSIQIEPDGKAILTEGNKSWDGKWRIEGDQMTITTDQESVTAQLDDQGGLLVKEGSGEAIAFRRAE